MKRTTILLLLVSTGFLAYSQDNSFEEMQKLQKQTMHQEVEKQEVAQVPSLERAPARNFNPSPGYVQKSLDTRDLIGYGWNAFAGASGVVEGPVTVSIPGGVLTSIQYVDTDVAWMTGGDFAEDTWYVVDYNVDGSGLYTVDITTGDYTLVGPTGINLTGLAYDQDNGIMYASGYTDPTSFLYTVDLATGAATQVGAIGSGIIIGIAADIDGNLYGLNLDNSLYSINPSTGVGTAIGDIGFNVNYAQDIGFDRDNGILYGTLYTSTGGFYQIDHTTGAATLLNTFTAEVCAFGVPYAFADPDAPAAVSGFNVAAGAAGALQASLTWTNPSTTADGGTLTELSSIVIERNAEVIHTITSPGIGAAGSYTDTNVPASGIYTYRIYGTNTYGEGLKTALNVFIGHDVPAGVSNLELVADGNNGLLTWDAPTEGLNGGYFTSAGLNYTIVRMPGETQVGTNVTGTSFLDETITSLGNYHYIVTAHNAHGAGGIAVSNMVLLGGDGLVGVTIGTGDLLPAYRAPFDLWYKNSLAQTMYYPDEMDGMGGAIMGVMYYNAFGNDLPGEPIRIYAATTQVEDFSEGYLHGENFTLVFEGDFDFPGGENTVIIPFNEPFVYTGGNLVLMTNVAFTDSYNGLSGDKFFSTETPERPARMRHMQSDTSIYDPEGALTGGTNRNVVPNTTLLFSVSGMGSLAGTVTDDLAAPLEGVKINIDGTSMSVYSDAGGEFLFPYIQEGEHSITASLLGYADATATVTIVEDQQTTVTLALNPVGVVSVSGLVLSNEGAPGEGLENATVSLTGYADYVVVTGADGTFTIADVFMNKTYDIAVSHETHLTYYGEVVVLDQDLVLDDIVLEATDVVEVDIGEGTTYPTSRIPFDFFYKNSISQTLYYPSEIGLSAGALFSISYYYNFTTDLSEGKPIRVWVGETELTSLADGWVDPSTLTLVYDGNAPLPAGDNELNIEFSEPYVYTGGNLVVYTQRVWEDQYYSSNDRFYGTLFADSGRTRRASADGTVYDPSEPAAGTLVHWAPNTTLFFNVAGLGSMAGTVTEGTDGIEGVMVSLSGTSQKAFTDSNGNYEFPYLMAGSYDVHFSKFGYEALTVQDIEIEADETTVVNAVLTAIPQYTVNGVIKGNDGPFIEGAVISLQGYDDYSAVSNPSGSFSIPGVYADTYSLTVSAEGYEIYVDQAVVVNSNTNLGEIILIEIIVAPYGLTIDVEGQGDGEALFTWNEAQLLMLYQHDGDIPAEPNAFYQTNDKVYGTIFDLGEYPDAVVSFMDFHHMQWGVPNASYEYLVHIVDWSTFTVLQTVGPLSTTVNDDWEEMVDLGEINVGGYSQVGILIQPQGYIPSDAYPCITTDATGPSGLSINATFSNLSGYAINGPTVGDFFLNLWITTSFGSKELVQAKGLTSGNAQAVMTRNGLSVPSSQAELTQYAQEVTVPEKAFLSFNVYLDNLNTPVATGITETQYLFTGLVEGSYLAGVQSVYTTGSSEIVTREFELAFGVEVMVDVTTNSGDDPQGATVMLVNQDLPQYEYTAIVDDAGVAEFPSIRKGTYTIYGIMTGYEMYESANHVIQDDATMSIELVEIIEAPFGLMVDWAGLDEGEVLFSWNNVTGENWAESFEGGALPAGWSQVINNTGSQAGFASTWYITGTVQLDVPIVPQDGSYQAFMMWSYNHQDEWLITPEFTATGEDLTFWYYGTNGSPNADNYYVKVSTDGGTSWDILWNASELPAGANHYSVPAVIDLSAYAGQDIQIAWNNVDGPTNDGLWFAWALDNITVGDQKIDVRDLIIMSIPPVDHNPAAKDGMFAPPVTLKDMGFNTSRSFVGYNVFINDMTTPVATEITSTEFMFTGLADGEYTAGVQSVYTSGASEIVTLDFAFDNGVEVPEGFEVVFNVDMINAEDFDPDNDVVYIAGIFDWQAPGDDPENQLMVATDDNPMIYTITLYLPAGEYEYKYFINAGWDGGEWAGVVNRDLIVVDDMVVNDIFGDPGVNVPEVDITSMKLFPNPATNKLYIQSELIMLEVRMIDILGQVVYNSQAGSQLHEINVGGIKPGFYFVQIVTSQGLTTHRIQVSK